MVNSLPHTLEVVGSNLLSNQSRRETTPVLSHLAPGIRKTDGMTGYMKAETIKMSAVCLSGTCSIRSNITKTLLRAMISPFTH